MRAAIRLLAVTIAALTTACLLASVASAAPKVGTGVKLSATLTGPAEAPIPGDPNASGTALFRINPGQGTICYVLTVSGIEPAFAAHIHIAPVGEPGPVVVPLNPPTSGSSSGCASVTRELALAIIHNPGAYYVNVHNADFPGGAARGQLTKGWPHKNS